MYLLSSVYTASEKHGLKLVILSHLRSATACGAVPPPHSGAHPCSGLLCPPLPPRSMVPMPQRL